MTKLKKSTIYFPDRATVQVSVDVDVKSSPEDVWNVLIDTDRWSEWFEGVTVSETTKTTPNGLGGTRKMIVGGGEFHEEFIAYEPMKLWGFCVFEAKPFAVAERWVERVALEPIQCSDGSTGTRMRYACGIEPNFLGRLMSPFLVKSMEGSWKRSMEAIDAVVASKKASPK